MKEQTGIQEKLSEELKSIVADAEELVWARGAKLAEKTEEIRDRLASALETARETLDTLETQATDGVKKADQAIRKYPYQSMGVALGIGLAIGLLFKQK